MYVPVARRTIQNQYFNFILVGNNKRVAIDMALGEASKVVMVVLNMVVKAAIAIKT
jgi:hypothetical protein